MNKIFFISILLLVVVFSLLLLSSDKTKWRPIQYVEAQDELVARDTLQLFEWNEGNWEEYFMGFNKQRSRNEAYFHGDTVDIRLSASFLGGGYVLNIQMIDDQFTSTLVSSSCISREKLRIKKQELILENLELSTGNTLKGVFNCEAKYLRPDIRVEKVKIEGYFEMDLVDVNGWPILH